MGYYSKLDGSITPTKPIPLELVQTINDLGLCVCVATSDSEMGDPGDIVPTSWEMKAYDLVTDIYRVSKKLLENGIRLNGEIYRAGEDSDDLERIKAVNGRIYVAGGEVVYRDKREITDEDITNYAVRVCKKRGRCSDLVGWATAMVRTDETPEVVYVPQMTESSKPPLNAYVTQCKDDAVKLVKRLRSKGFSCSVFSWRNDL